MNRYLQSALVVAALGLASVTCALAQEDTAPPPASTAPSPSTSSTEPSTTEHSNRQAGSKETQKQMMKDCVAKEQADNSGVSASQAKKNCKAQMKANGSQPKNY
jgi:hypothetical protein